MIGDTSDITGSEIEECLHIMRTADSIYPDDKDFINIPVYKRHNLATRCNMRTGDTVIDVPLLQLDGSYTSLVDVMNSHPDSCTLVIASSRS